MASQFREETMKETDILGHVPCSTLPQKDYNIDLRDTLEESKDMCWTCLARFYMRFKASLLIVSTKFSYISEWGEKR